MNPQELINALWQRLPPTRIPAAPPRYLSREEIDKIIKKNPADVFDSFGLLDFKNPGLSSFTLNGFNTKGITAFGLWFREDIPAAKGAAMNQVMMYAHLINEPQWYGVKAFLTTNPAKFSLSYLQAKEKLMTMGYMEEMAADIGVLTLLDAEENEKYKALSKRLSRPFLDSAKSVMGLGLTIQDAMYPMRFMDTFLTRGRPDLKLFQEKTMIESWCRQLQRSGYELKIQAEV